MFEIAKVTIAFDPRARQWTIEAHRGPLLEFLAIYNGAEELALQRDLANAIAAARLPRLLPVLGLAGHAVA
jgi:hypothetical protein